MLVWNSPGQNTVESRMSTRSRKLKLAAILVIVIIHQMLLPEKGIRRFQDLIELT